jgi:hypothetical protein
MLRPSAAQYRQIACCTNLGNLTRPSCARKQHNDGNIRLIEADLIEHLFPVRPPRWFAYRPAIRKQDDLARATGNRTRRIAVRLSESDHRRLVERARRAGAKTPSAYLRAAALTGQEFELPAWGTLRDLRNEVIKLTAAVKAHPRAVDAAIAALDRISRF